MTRRCPRCNRGIAGAHKKKRKKQMRSTELCTDCRNADLIDQLAPAPRKRTSETIYTLRDLKRVWTPEGWE